MPHDLRECGQVLILLQDLVSKHFNANETNYMQNSAIFFIIPSTSASVFLVNVPEVKKGPAMCFRCGILSK